MRPLTKTEFARERGVSRARVYQWIDDGRIGVIVGTEHDGKIDADDAHSRLGALLDQTKGIRRDGNITSEAPASEELLFGDAGNQAERQTPTSKNDTDYWAHKAKEQEYVTLLTQAKYFKEAGALTSAAGVRKEALETARALRNAAESIADRLAPVLDPANPARAHKLILGEVRKVMREFSHRMGERAAAAGAEQSDPVLV